MCKIYGDYGRHGYGKRLRHSIHKAKRIFYAEEKRFIWDAHVFDKNRVNQWICLWVDWNSWPWRVISAITRKTLFVINLLTYLRCSKEIIVAWEGYFVAQCCKILPELWMLLISKMLKLRNSPLMLLVRQRHGPPVFNHTNTSRLHHDKAWIMQVNQYVVVVDYANRLGNELQYCWFKCVPSSM